MTAVSENRTTVADVERDEFVAEPTGPLEASRPAVGTAQKPAVPIERSIWPDFIICLEDGQDVKLLKRYLKRRHGLTPNSYRAKWGLPPDYPMVAPNYSKQRSANTKIQWFRKKNGL